MTLPKAEWWFFVGGLVLAGSLEAQPVRLTPAERIAIVLRETQPLRYPLENRLQLYLWPVEDLPGDDVEVERTLRALTDRGIAAYSSWRADQEPAKSLESSLRIAALQKRLNCPRLLSCRPLRPSRGLFAYP